MGNLDVIIGNVCSLLAMGTDSIGSAQKTASRVLWWQTLSQFTYLTGAVILRGYSAAVQNGISIVRNLVAIKGWKSKLLEWFLIIAGVVLGLVFNNREWIGILPVVANLQYTLSVFRFKDNEKALKVSFLICNIMFGFFNFAILNIVGLCANIFVAITTAVFIFRKHSA